MDTDLTYLSDYMSDDDKIKKIFFIKFTKNIYL